MEKSIINRSTNKKLGRRQKFTTGSKLVSVNTTKLEKKNLESFRGVENAIKEEH